MNEKIFADWALLVYLGNIGTSPIILYCSGVDIGFLWFFAGMLIAILPTLILSIWVGSKENNFSAGYKLCIGTIDVITAEIARPINKEIQRLFSR